MSVFPSSELNPQDRRHQRGLLALEAKQKTLLTNVARRYSPLHEVEPLTEKEASMESEIKKLLLHLQHAHLFRFQGASYWYDKPMLIDQMQRKKEIDFINKKEQGDIGDTITPVVNVGPLTIAYFDAKNFCLMAYTLGDDYKKKYEKDGSRVMIQSFGNSQDMNFFAEGWDYETSGYRLDTYLNRMERDEKLNMIINRTKPMKYGEKDMFGVVIGTNLIRESGDNGFRNAEGRFAGQPATFMFLFDQEECAASAQKLIGEHPEEFLQEFHQQFISGENLGVPENNPVLSTLIFARETYKLFTPSAQIEPKLDTKRSDYLVTPH